MQVLTRRIWLEAGIIFVLGVVLGLSVNIQMVMDAFSGRLTTVPRPAAVVADSAKPVNKGTAPAVFPVPVLLDEVRELLRVGAVVIDARTIDAYDEGHLPKAIALPLGEMAGLLKVFERNVAKDATLIVYCSGFGCPDSFDVGMRLLEAGYVDVRVYEGGFPEWRDAGLPVTKEAP
jgi:rhodanese-related sulfurtransferase